jgi:hypothetical protein
MFRRLIDSIKSDYFDLGPRTPLYNEEERRISRLIKQDMPEALDLGYFPSLTPPEDRPVRSRPPQQPPAAR